MKTCKYINNTLVFTSESITPCYSCFADKAPYYLKTKNTENENLDFKNTKQIILNEINSEKIQEFPCSNCSQLIEYKEIPDQYKQIILCFWNNQPIKYNIFEVIQDLYKQNLIDSDNLFIEFQSGDIDNFRELNKLISMFEANGYKQISFLMNNIVYRPFIDEILKQGKGTLSVIFDPRDKRNSDISIFAKILRMYIGNAKDKNSIKIYYTLIKDINDNKKDIKNFIETIFKVGINIIGLRLDYQDIANWINKPIPLKNCKKDYSKLIIYFFKIAKKYSFYLDMDYPEQNIVMRKILKTNKIQNKSFIEKIKDFFINKTMQIW